MAIEDNEIYGLLGSQIKELPADILKIAAGKAKELTTADYNYPTTGTPTSVALWLLSPGVYTTNGNVTLRAETSSTMEGVINTIIIGEAVGNYYPVIAMGPNRLSSGVKVQYHVANISGSSSIRKNILTSDDIYSALDSISNTTALAAAQGKVLKDLVDSLAIRGAGAPTTTTVGQVGTLYEDTTNGDLYICTDATNPYVWEAVGAGGGPTVVQTTGTSTTDVMSQNATTSMIFADPATQYKIKIGNGTSTNEGANSVEIGHNSKADGSTAVALGDSAKAQSTYSIALGSGSGDSYDGYEGAISIGRDSRAKAKGAIALGISSGYTGMAVGEMHIGTNNTTYGYNSSNYRLLTGLYDGQSAHDAATKGQLDSIAIQNAGTPTTSTVGTVGQLLEDTTNGKLYICTAIVPGTDPDPDTYTWEELGGGPTVVQTTGTSTTDVMSQNAVTSMLFGDPSVQRNVKIGKLAGVGVGGIAIGNQASSNHTGAVAIGEGSSANGNYSIALGKGSRASAGGEMNIGAASGTGATGYNNSVYRLLTGLYDGQDAHDAATVAQGNKLMTVAPTTTDAGVLGQLWTDTTNMHTYQCTAIDTTDPDNPSYTWTQRW